MDPLCQVIWGISYAVLGFGMGWSAHGIYMIRRDLKPTKKKEKNDGNV
jgi:hypothetical protein